MTYLKVNVSEQGIQTIILNRPEKRHALNVGMMHALVESFTQAFEDDGIKCIVLKSSGPVFCAGADLNDMHEQTDDFIASLIALINVLQQKNKPIYVPLTSAVYGGGSILLSFADVIVALDDIQIVMPEIKSHLWPVFLLPLLKNHLPQDVLTEMAMHATPLTAKRAYSLGWFCDVQSQDQAVVQAIDDLANRYCQLPQTSLKAFYQCHRKVFMDVLNDQTLAQLGSQLKTLVSIKKSSAT